MTKYLNKFKIIIIIMIACIVIIIPLNALSYTPPANSPLALKLHPRLLFIPQSYRDANPNAVGMTIQEMRSKLNMAAYSSGSRGFQTFIDLMDANYSASISSKSKLDVTYDAINYAFLYVIDPSKMPSFSFAHTKAEYGGKALSHTQFIASEANINPSSWVDQYTYSLGGGSYNESITNLSLAIVNDWLNDIIPISTQQLIIDAMVKLNNLVKIEVLTSFKHFGNAQNGGGVIGLYGDSIDTSGSFYSGKMDSLLNGVNNDWLRSFKDLSNLVYEGGSNHVEGIGYDDMGFRNMMPFIDALSTALNENLFNDITYLGKHIYYSLYRIKPLPYGGKWHIFATDDSGTESSATLDWGRNDILLYAMIHNLKGDEASLAKWVKDTYYTSESLTQLRYYGVFVYFFNGFDGIVARSPSNLRIPTSLDVGMGQYIMRTGFEDTSDSAVIFFAPKFHVNDGGHAHRDFGSFNIFKYGNLAIDRQIAKSYSQNVEITRQSMFRNTIGVLKPGEVSGNYNVMGYRGGFNSDARYTTDSAFQENGANHVGTVVAEDLEGSNYDYINYDYSNSWDDAKVDYAQREFVYLRPQGGTNDEYIVVFDRINAISPSYKKFWLFHANFEPRLLRDNSSVVTMTAENYPNDPDGGGGRWVHKSASPASDNIIEITNTYDVFHARLFNKTLLPDSFQINKVGGPNHYWEDANGKSIETPASLSDYQKNTFGSFTMQVESTTNNNYDNFLNVMQFGDSNTLFSMNQTTRIDGNTMVGTLINDPNIPRIVMFSKGQNGVQVSAVTYNANYPSSKTGKHLLVDMSPGTYDVYKNGNKILSDITSSSQGVLFFDSTGGSTFQIVQTGSAPPTDNTPPVLSNGYPSGTLSPGTTSATLSLTTDENATCKYANTSGVDYSSMTNNFSTTGGTSHSTTIIGLQDGQTYNYYVKAQDSMGNTNTNDYLISFTIASASSDIQAPSIPTNLTAQAVSSSQINLVWNVSTDNIGVTGYKIYKDGIQITTIPNTSYQDTGLFLSTTYSYTVSAYDAAGNESGQSTASQATTTGDTTSPRIFSASVSGDTKVIITFSEPVELSSATDTSNYSINNGIVVSGASLGSDLKTVTLTTSPHTGGVSYILTVNNIKDRASVPNVIVSNTQKTYTYIPPTSGNLVVSNLNPSNYQTANLVIGNQYYTDRTYTISSIPSSYGGLLWIKTGNNDKSNTSSSFLSFDINKDVAVHVAYDSRASSPPNWLASAYANTGSSITVNEGAYGSLKLNVWKKNHQAGTVVLGGNSASGAVGSGSMYAVFMGSSGFFRSDLNQDGTVNALDWSIMNAKWNTADPQADINKDGVVNTLDWSIMNGNWSG